MAKRSRRRPRTPVVTGPAQLDAAADGGISVIANEQRTAYIQGLQSAHSTAMSEVRAAQDQLSGLNATIAGRLASARQAADQLASLGVEPPQTPGIEPPPAATVVRRGRGRPRGPRAAASENGTTPTGRPRGQAKLPEAIVSFMNSQRKGTRFEISDVLDGVVKAGYHTNAENFRTIVNQRLTQMVAATRPLIRKAERGVYELTARGQV